MMRVAFVNRMLGIRKSGGGMWDYKMAEQLRKRGVDVTFYVAEPLTGQVTEDLSPFSCIPVPTPHLQDIAYAAPRGIGGVLADIDTRAFAKRVHSKLIEKDFDIVQYNTNREFARYTNQIGAPAVLKLNGPPYSLWRDVLNPFARTSYDVLNDFDDIITTGVTTQKIRDNTDITPTEINPGVDTSQFVSKSASGESHRFLFVGRFVPAKNLTLLLHSFSQFLNQYPDSELVLVGDGPLKDRLADIVDTNGISDSVTFAGYVDNDKIHQYYAESSAVVLSSKTENHPIVLLEAMSAGIPVIAPDLGAIPEIVDNNQNGLLFEPGSEDDLVDAMSKLANNPEEATRMGENGRQKAVEEFDWEQRGRKLKSLYDRLLDQTS